MAIETDAVLSFSAPGKLRTRIEAAPSATFELVQVLLRLSLPPSKTRHLDFIRDLQQRRPDLADEVKRLHLQNGDALKNGDALGWNDLMLVLLLLAAHGHAKSSDAQAFLDDLPALIKRATPRFEDEFEKSLEEAAPEEREEGERFSRAILGCLRALQKRAKLEPYLNALQALWDELSPYWHAQGLSLIMAECERINRELAAGRSLLELLPEHHHLHAETHQRKLERYLKEDNHRGILLTPLYFIGVGGHAFDVSGEMFLAFGLEDEGSRQKRTAYAQDLAGRMKAFADPTRMMILSLICDFSSKLTVSDLAAQFGLSQPTVSGHLKLLKEAGLVSVSKEGTKAYYSANAKAVAELLGDVRDFIMPWQSR